MERTNKPKATAVPGSDEKVRWKKEGGGTFVLGKKLIKPGQVFTASLNEIPAPFRNLCKPLDGLPAPDKKPEVAGKKSTYTIQPRPGEEGKYNITNEKGKVVNGEGLELAKAQELLVDLNK